MSENSLPVGWLWTTIPEIVGHDGVFSDGDWVESKDQDPNGDVRLIQLADIGDGIYRNRSNRFLTKAKADELNCTFLKSGDVLIARMPDPLGRACLFPGDPKTSVTVVDVCVVRTGSSRVDHRWLMHMANSPKFRQEIANLQSGSTRKRISRRNLAKVELPLPPLAEQRRIVAEIEKQLTRLEAGVAALKQARARLQRYKAAVLKAACEGRLVEQDPADEPASVLLAHILAERRQKWAEEQRAKGKDPAKLKYKEPAAPDVDGLSELPEGWVWVNFSSLLREPLRNGHSAKASQNDDGIRTLTLTAVTLGDFSLENTKVTVADPSKVKNLWIQPGDIFIERSNTPELVGTTRLYRGKSNFAVFLDLLIRARVVDKISAQYIEVVLQSDITRSYFKRSAQGISGTMPKISQGTIENALVPLPPFAEQQRIVEEVERRLSVVEEVEGVIAANLKRAGRLRQAVLRQAFEGRLVPQDPDDESASVLLERVRKAKAEAEGKKRQGNQMRLPGV